MLMVLIVTWASYVCKKVNQYKITAANKKLAIVVVDLVIKVLSNKLHL